ncbi:ABC transporter, permease component [Actinomycetales bacterium JB111]|nr:ABC transporter, permease component [Actinomycetales bacterium JB111]
MRAIVTIARTELLRFVRDTSNIFFVFIFPLILVAVLGLQFGGGGGGGNVSLAGADSDLRDDTVAALEAQDLEVTVSEADYVRNQVARGSSDVGLFITDDEAAAYDDGQAVSVEMIASSSQNGPAVQQRVTSAIEVLSLGRAEADALVGAGADAGAVPDALDAARQSVPATTVTVTDVDAIAQEFSGVGQFEVGAASQLLLFVFLTSLANSSSLIAARREGVTARSMAAPIGSAQMMAGLSLGRWVIALFQGVYIMVASSLLFSVGWGNIWLSALVLAVFALVAAGVGMLLGALLDNEGAAVGVGVGLGLVLAGIGGGMAPLEIFSDTMRQIAHVTPHAWAYDAFASIVRHDGTLTDILPMLGVLAAFAVVALALGTWALRRSMLRAM